MAEQRPSKPQTRVPWPTVAAVAACGAALLVFLMLARLGSETNTPAGAGTYVTVGAIFLIFTSSAYAVLRRRGTPRRLATAIALGTLPAMGSIPVLALWLLVEVS